MGRAGARREQKTSQRGTILILSQVYVPDPAAVGQYMAAVGVEMASRGYPVTVITSRNGYENPADVYPAREVRDGVRIVRLPFSSFGKSFLFARMLGAIFFVVQAALYGLFVPHVSAVLVSTSPPVCAFAGLFLRCIRRAPFLYWLMDLNPDQLIALGALRAGSWSARMIEKMNRLALREAATVVVLDRFMSDRVCSKVDVASKILVIPPWPHEDHLEAIPHGRNPFRSRLGLGGKRVVMYSGNHSSSNPLWTILHAARELDGDSNLAFVFVGGGLSKKQIEEYVTRHRMQNVTLLPYQPFDELRYSLSAADVHVVSLGEQFVGILHPCKVYGAMACGRPLLYLGPEPSHVSEMLEGNDIGWHVAHGDVPAALRALLSIRDASPKKLTSMGAGARRLLHHRMDQVALRGAFCDSLEQVASGHSSVFHPTSSVAAGSDDRQVLEPSQESMDIGAG